MSDESAPEVDPGELDEALAERERRRPKPREPRGDETWIAQFNEEQAR